MNDEQVDRMKQVIHTYSEWLGMWGVMQDPAYNAEYYEGEFYGQYGYRELLLDSEKGYYRLMRFELGYGDDGGNSELFCLFPREDNTLMFLLHEFDTRVSPIYDATGEGPEFLTTPKAQGYS